ncbi:pimeloyl-ACP methyl ester carboxylesterase [Paraburkholderia sp. WSM4179]|nr:pimeloyl-ACP methyl ester carboxylesterase [Paraburkholderia sp. WSM4179]
MHDFGGPVGMGLASRHPDRVRRIISVNGPTPFGQATLVDRWRANAKVSPWFQWILNAEAEGRLDAVLGELGFNILSTLKLNGFEDHGLINDTWLRAYGSRFATPAECAGEHRDDPIRSAGFAGFDEWIDQEAQRDREQHHAADERVIGMTSYRTVLEELVKRAG